MWKAQENSCVSDLRRFESMHDELTARSGSTQRWKAAVPLFIVFE
jgi:hypothetical protein